MKKDQFSYLNGRALSHASLQKFRNQTLESKGQKETFTSKPIIKYYVNSNQNKNSVAVKTEQKRFEMSKNQQELKKKIKVLQYQLKNKLSQNSMMVKFFRSKNSSELAHIDIYLQFRRVQQQLEQKDEKIEQLNQKIEQISKQLEQMLQKKQQQEDRHTNQIQNCLKQLQKLEKKHREEKEQQIIEQKKRRIEKEKQIMEQKKKTEEKDELLRQIRKQYEQSRQKIIELQNQLCEIGRDKVEIQKIYKQKLENAKEDQEVKIEEKRREKLDLQKKMKQLYEKIKEQEQKIKMTHQKYTQRQLQKLKNMKGMENQINVLKKQIGQKMTQIHSLTQQRTKYIQNVRKIEELVNSKSTIIQELTIKLAKNAQITKLNKQQLDETKSQVKDVELKKQKALHQIKILQQKLAEANGKNKSMQFQIEQKQVFIEKLKNNMQQKQRYIKQKQKYIEEIECKAYNNQRKITNYLQKIKEMQNQLVNGKQLQAKQSISKLQIQNYKSIGRLLELIHQVKALSQNREQNDHRNRNNGYRSRKNEIQTITECIDELNKQFDLFIKLYASIRQENKSHKQFVQEIISDIKAIFHTYNSYIQDQQLKGASRQYLECLETNDKNYKKERNSYLQVIMQRLISMIAIQSYTSENGLKRNSESRARLSNRRDLDSLENTYQNLQENEEKQQIKPYLEERGYRRRGLQAQVQRYSRNSQNKRKSSYNKITTQPNQECYNIRKLDYGNKQNILQRINRGDGQANKYNYCSVEEKDRQSEKFKFYQPSSTREAVLKKLKNYAKEPEVRQRKLSNKDTELIEKKYFS